MEKVTQISGPVSLYITEIDGRRIFIFGDVHYSKDLGCQDVRCDRLTDQKNNVILYGEKCMNIDAALHTVFLYNSRHQISTDFFFETPIIKGKYAAQRHQQAAEQYDEVGWLGSMEYLTSLCFEYKNRCVYGKNVRIHYADARQQIYGQESSVGELYTSLYEMPKKFSKRDLAQNIKDLFALMNLLLKEVGGKSIVDMYFDAVFKSNGFSSLDKIRRIIQRDLHNGLVKTEALSTLSTMISRSGTKNVREYKEGGETKREHMHKSAWQLLRLFRKNPAIGKKVFAFLRKEHERTKKEITEALTIYDVTMTLDEFEKDKSVIREILNSLLGSFVDIGTYVMDGYLLARMFVQDSKMSFVFAGDFHAKTYIKFFEEELGLGPLLYENNSYHIDGELLYGRCVFSDALPDYLDLNTMRTELKAKDVYEATRAKIVDLELQ